MVAIIEGIFAILGTLLGFLMILVIVLRDSISNYLDAKAEELRARARKEEQNDEE